LSFYEGVGVGDEVGRLKFEESKSEVLKIEESELESESESELLCTDSTVLVLSTRYKPVLPERGSQSQLTFLFVILLCYFVILSYQGFGFMKPPSGCTYTRASRLYTVGREGLLLYKHRSNFVQYKIA
jgi:hypothetical protein